MATAEKLILSLQRKTSAEDLIGTNRKPRRGSFRVKIKRRPIVKIKRFETAGDLISDLESETSAEDLIGTNRKPRRGSFKLKTRRFKLRPRVKLQRKSKRIFSNVGKQLVSGGRTVSPIIKRQIELIKRQQLRDQGVQRLLKKRNVIGKKSKPQKKKRKKRSIKVIKTKTKSKSKVSRKPRKRSVEKVSKKPRKRSVDNGFFAPLDF